MASKEIFNDLRIVHRPGSRVPRRLRSRQPGARSLRRDREATIGIPLDAHLPHLLAPARPGRARRPAPGRCRRPLEPVRSRAEEPLNPAKISLGEFVTGVIAGARNRQGHRLTILPSLLGQADQVIE